MTAESVKAWRKRLGSGDRTPTWWTETGTDSLRALFHTNLPGSSKVARFVGPWPEASGDAELGRTRALLSELRKGAREVSFYRVVRIADDEPALWALAWLGWPSESELPPWPAVFDPVVSGWLCAKVEGAGRALGTPEDWKSDTYSQALRWATLSQFSNVSAPGEEHGDCFKTAELIRHAYEQEQGVDHQTWLINPSYWPESGTEKLTATLRKTLDEAKVLPGDEIFVISKGGQITRRSQILDDWQVRTTPLASPRSHDDLPAGGAVVPVPASLRLKLLSDAAPGDVSTDLGLVTRLAVEPEPVNRIVYGPPGTGKTWSTTREALELCGIDVKRIKDDEVQRIWFAHLTKRDRIALVTFHPSFEYEDFIVGLRPLVTGLDGAANLGPSVSFERRDGAFKAMCDRALAAFRQSGGVAVPPQFVVVIDEINRGNISRIFGELLTLIEREKRYGMSEAAEARLPGATKNEAPFTVPRNLHLLGTMNTADRSIALMDVALRRRFEFKELMPDARLVGRKLLARGVADELATTAQRLLEVMNERVTFLYDRDHQIGHSFFLKVRSWAGLRDVMLEEVIPLLQEYFYGSWDKVCLVLGCPWKLAAKRAVPARKGLSVYAHPVINAKARLEQDVLGLDHDDYEDKLDYEVNPAFADKATSDPTLKAFFKGIIADSRATTTDATGSVPGSEGGSGGA